MTAKKKGKQRIFKARSGDVLKIGVDVTETKEGTYKPVTEDPDVLVQGGLAFIVWKLKKSARDWKFQASGVAFRSKKGQAQFIHPHRFNEGSEFAMINRNTDEGRFKYTVSLQHRTNSHLKIDEDPIIENEGDGKP